ncbi:MULTISPECIES: thioredoxin family protein [unclassified Marinobacter]|uniref:thioredoxin family protein n=1 Tax=unclassified Marinobacter TaxID=83889 RepID=UPI0026E439B8|nr:MULTISPECIES: thioredoxin family protein [unclassified Marinobacter]MDO6441512.1 thioredoxin family protein [Marinobacter sp. 2_MG-2023]MDO6822325.1 thioredoxin family protein [Marinobacter sp. 1_MG-2023]
MKITIYGSGCSKCKQLTVNAEEAANELGLSYEVEKVTDVNAIIDAGIMRTPALALNDEIVAEGKVASPADIKKYLS